MLSWQSKNDKTSQFACSIEDCLTMCNSEKQLRSHLRCHASKILCEQRKKKRSITLYHAKTKGSLHSLSGSQHFHLFTLKVIEREFMVTTGKAMADPQSSPLTSINSGLRIVRSPQSVVSAETSDIVEPQKEECNSSFGLVQALDGNSD